METAVRYLRKPTSNGDAGAQVMPRLMWRLLAAAERHAAASLPQVTGSDYMVEHWLAAYATLLLG